MMILILATVVIAAADAPFRIHAAGTVVIAAADAPFRIHAAGTVAAINEDCPASIYDHSVSSEGAIKLPVFHKKHPCLLMTDQAQEETTIDVVEFPKTNDFAFLMPVLLGTPPVMNLVNIDTGSTFPWVQCQPCSPRCHEQSQEAGQIFDPTKSTTFRRVKCKSRDCYTIKYGLKLLFANCMEKEDTCLYAVSYGFNWVYTAGKVVRDNVMFGKDSDIMSMDLLFGCSQDVGYPHEDAGIFGFGRDSYSFFEQVASRINYKAFSYCLPADETVRGYMVLGDYDREDVDMYTPLFPSARTPTYSLRLARIVANGQSIPVPSSSSEMMVDSGAKVTLLSGDTYTSLEKIIAEAMAVTFPDYVLSHSFHLCYDSHNNSLGKEPREVFSDWSSLPLVEMVFDRAGALPIPRKNLFFNDRKLGLCLSFRRTDTFQILGNRVTRSFKTIFDIQGKKFGFKSADC